MRTVLAFVAVSFLVACNPSKEDFAAQMAELTCQKANECYGAAALGAMGYDSEADCITSMSEEARTAVDDETECPNYDGAKAAECLEAFEAVTCDGMDGLTACDDVCGSTGASSGTSTAR